MGSDMTNARSPQGRDGVDQDQFLTILSREDALARFEAALFPRAIPSELRPLSDALGCALAADIVAPNDVPPFDRSNVDGFAVRSADLASAGEATPVRLMLNDEVIACGTAPTRPLLSGTATSIATGGPLPRGADAVVMVEHTQPAGHRAIEVLRGGLLHGIRHVPANRVHEDVNPFESGEDFLRDSVHLSRLRDVRLEQRHVLPKGSEDLLEVRELAVQEIHGDHGCTRFREGFAHGRAEVARSARHDHDLPVQPATHRLR